MIAVIADKAEHHVVSEFFELFKTPWEFYQPGKSYKVLLCTADVRIEGSFALIVQYKSSRSAIDNAHKIQTGSQCVHASAVLSSKGRLPIYGTSISFPGNLAGWLSNEDSGESVAFVGRSGQETIARVGYDLFAEVRTLLTAGQPEINSSMPAVELHIDLLRELITQSGVPLVEVPPVPEGYPFAVCLTHDVDHPSIRQHKWDHTAFGFLRRALFGSIREFVRARISLRALLKNWWTALTLPLVYLGILSDFWREFADRYSKIELGLRSTYFVIPFRSRAGKTSQGDAPPFRAAQYGARDIADLLQKVTAAGCEVGLHGIDAWLDSSKGGVEFDEIRSLTGTPEVGVRMHWLYYDEQSPCRLEQAGASYDSTVGYNGAIGYRAGTTQVYKPLNVNRLLELPLHAMDTAMFYPAHLGLSSDEATELLNRLADNAIQFGGCLTINWHDRSLAPERMWDDCYRQLIDNLKTRGAWFCTASQEVSWFRKRRSVVFEADAADHDTLRARVSAPYSRRDLPGLRLRIHKALDPNANGMGAPKYVDVPFGERVEIGGAFATV